MHSAFVQHRRKAVGGFCRQADRLLAIDHRHRFCRGVPDNPTSRRFFDCESHHAESPISDDHPLTGGFFFAQDFSLPKRSGPGSQRIVISFWYHEAPNGGTAHMENPNPRWMRIAGVLMAFAVAGYLPTFQ